MQRLTESLGELPEPVAEPTFIAVSGLPGTGKSYFCNKLAERLPLIILESDALRKTLFSPPDYSSEENTHLFRAIHLLIERLLRKGYSLILDATNLSERYREYLYSIASRLDVRLVLVRVEAPPQLVRERLKSRLENAETEFRRLIAVGPDNYRGYVNLGALLVISGRFDEAIETLE